MKRIVSLILCAVLVMGMLPSIAFAATTVASGTCGDNLTWVLDDEGTLTISGSGEMADYENYYSTPWENNRLDILKVVLEAGVSSIGNHAFDSCVAMTSIIMPDSVTSIGDSAFNDCGVLNNVSLPDALISIGNSAFYSCKALTGIVIPDSVTHIGKSAFGFCSALANVSLSNNITSIGNGTFYYTAISTMIIPDSVTSIGAMAFSYSDIANLSIPDSVCTIGDYVFAQCRELTEITIGSGVTTIGSDVFQGCSKLVSITVKDENCYFSNDSRGVLFDKNKTSLICAPACLSGSYTVPESVNTIENSAFLDCTQITDITLPVGLKKIGNSAFKGCIKLVSIDIPAAVASIGSSAFYGCNELTGIWVSELNEHYSSDSKGVLFDIDKTVLICAPIQLTGSYEVPVSVTSISSNAFSRCIHVSNITIPGSVQSIGYSAFNGCYGLRSATISEGVELIGEKAFYDCFSMDYLHIPDSVTSIGESAFYSCDDLTEVIIGAGVKAIGKNAFQYCKSLEAIRFRGNAPTFGVATFAYVTATAYYHGTYTTWTPDVLQNYYGTITWVAEDCTPEAIPAVDPTCTGTGLTAGSVCAICRVPLSEQEIVPALGHDYEYSVTEIPNELSMGTLTGICSRCDESVTVSLPALNTSDYMHEVTSVATCTEDGSERYTWKTTTYGSVFFDIPIPAYGHSYVGTVTSPTCITQGFTTYCCSVCDHMYVGSYVDALGHSYVSIITLPTCISQGYTTFTCSQCGHTYKGDYVPTGDHTWDEGSVTKVPSETETGIMTYRCTVCGTTKTEIIAVLDHTHSYNSVVTNPNCTQQGYTTYTCACGDTYKSNYTPALNHNYFDGICTRCGEEDSGYEPPKPTVDGVYRIAGADRIETSIGIANALKETLGVEKFSNIVVASALNFPDALAGSYLAALKDAPILLTYDAVHAKIAQYIADNLENHGTVYILGGEGAVSKKFEYELSARVVHFERVAGNDRFSTNMRILETAKVPTGSTVLVCTALNFADSLSVSATGLPILLVHGSLRPDQMVFLNMVKPESIYVVGGTSAVSDATMKEIKDLLPNATLERIWGENRHVTSATVAKEFFPDAKSAVVAYSRNFPDGLCGGPLAYALGAPLLLTVSGDKTPNAYTDYYEINAGYVLGSGELVNDPSVRSIFHMSTADPIN